MADPKRIPIELIADVVEPDFETGQLFWKERTAEPPHLSEQWARWWNANMAGKPVCNLPAPHGGVKVRILKGEYYLHRLLFALAYGEQPEQIDHIDGNRANNTLSNLRASSYRDNMRNKACYKNNRLGHANIRQRLDRGGRYVVSFNVNGKTTAFGTYQTLGEAIARRDQVKAELGFHQNHGRRA